MSHFSGKVQDRNAILLLKMFGFWLHWAFVAAYRLSLVVASRGRSSCSAQVPH